MLPSDGPSDKQKILPNIQDKSSKNELFKCQCFVNVNLENGFWISEPDVKQRFICQRDRKFSQISCTTCTSFSPAAVSKSNAFVFG